MVDQKDILISENIVDDPVRVRRILARRVREFLTGHGLDDELRIVRLVARIPPIDPFSWLRAQEQLPKIFWGGRDDQMRTAAVGAADRCFAGPGADYDALRSQLDAVLPRSDVRVRYFGGFRFDREVDARDGWESYGTFAFTLPRFELLSGGESTVLACNLILPRDVEKADAILAAIDGLRFDEAPRGHRIPTPISRSDRPDKAGWKRKLDWTLDAFRSNEKVALDEKLASNKKSVTNKVARSDSVSASNDMSGDAPARLQKVVLAREARFGFAEPLDPISLLQELDAVTANCFSFGFQFEEGEAFVGATPERLFLRDGRRIWTEAVAGTRPRAETPEEDDRQLRSLLESEKDQREHAYVRESIRHALLPLCSDFQIDEEASSMKLSRSWHLVSRCRGMLLPDVHGSDVMRALHPTPAVGGHPTAPAIEAIRSLEPFDRGWYAGPVGWIGSHAAEFAVALRCGLVRGEELSLYSGAGIVEGSDPDAEWAEIEQKLGDFIKVLGLEQRSRG